jgi:hypothetical protein
VLVLIGLYYSLKNMKKNMEGFDLKTLELFLSCLPGSLFLVAVAVTMLSFFTN